MLLYKLDTEEV